ncbi:uncharacterized protein LOC116066290 [Sander lucioperca]|uniref:uncharacterized protein LOC116066290 n=1 Tax=Sander lucioperca TaxID=283035 RepID=UPI00125DB203|nr:uncharacterized protein LOC116066290 [Sander lucioperca]
MTVDQPSPHQHQEDRYGSPTGAVQRQSASSYGPHRGATSSTPDVRYRSLPNDACRWPDDKFRPLPDDTYHRYDNSHIYPAESYRQPSLRAHRNDCYYREGGRNHPSDRRGYPEDRYRSANGYDIYYGPDDQYQHWNDRYPDDLRRYYDHLHPAERPQAQLPFGRHPPVETYSGPKPTIPDFKHEDPREFAILKLALDNILPPDASEQFKFQILTDHLKCEEALLIADSYSNGLFPFSDTMRALTEMYGQPQQLALKRISNLMGWTQYQEW